MDEENENPKNESKKKSYFLKRLIFFAFLVLLQVVMWENLSQSKLSYVSMPYPGAVYSSVLLSDFLFRNLKTKIQPSPKETRKLKHKTQGFVLQCVTHDSFFGRRNLLYPGTYIQKKPSYRAQKFEGVFSPPSIRPYVLKLPVLGNEYEFLSLSLGPGGFCQGFVWLVFCLVIFCYLWLFWLSKESCLISSRSGICGVRGPFQFVD